MRHRLSVAATIAFTILALLAVPAGASAAKRHRHGPGATSTHLSAACAGDSPVATTEGKKGRSPRQSAPAGCATGTTLARLVAAGITHGGAAARERAMVMAMRYLHIGVMSASGKPIVTVPEIGAAQYFQLYDFELSGIAQELSSGTTESADDLAATLNRLAGGSLKVGGKPVSGAAVRQLLVQTTRYALKHANDPGSRLALLVRELGRRHRGPRYDLAKNPPTAKIALDPLQSALVKIALVLPALRSMHAPAPRARGHAHASIAAAAASATAPPARASGMSFAAHCGKVLNAEAKAKKWVMKQLGKVAAGRWISSGTPGFVAGEGLKGAWTGAKMWFKRGLVKAAKALEKSSPKVFENLGEATQVAMKVLAAANALHDVLLSAFVSVHTWRGAQETHWDHGDGTTGKPMTFRVLVRMEVNLHKTIVKCGTMLGFKFPPKGPIPGVPVWWGDHPNPGDLTASMTDIEDDDLTPDMGTTNCGALRCTTDTAANGVASLVFTPNKEPIPGTGPEFTKKGHIYPTVLYQTAEGGSIFMGQIAQFLVPMGTGNPAWTVTYHKVPNFVLDFQATVSPEQAEDDNSFGLGCDVTTKVTDSGAVTVEGSLPLQLGSDPGANPTALSWQPSGTLPLKHTDTSLEETGYVDNCGTPEQVHDTITQVHDGVMSVKGVNWSASGPGPVGLTTTFQVTDEPTENDYCDSCYWVTNPQQRPGWLDAVNQALLGANWDGEEDDLQGQQYTVSDWQRSTAPGVYATADIDDPTVIDNDIIGTFVKVHVHLELRPVARGS